MPPKGYKFSEESKAKMSASCKAAWANPKKRAARTKPLKNRPRSQETKDKIKASKLAFHQGVRERAIASAKRLSEKALELAQNITV